MPLPRPSTVSTVYRTVSRLEELGLVHSISTPTEALVRARAPSAPPRGVHQLRSRDRAVRRTSRRGAPSPRSRQRLSTQPADQPHRPRAVHHVSSAPVMRVSPLRTSILLAYAAFILVGIRAGVGGVLLVAQIRDYDVDKATIGLTFFTFSAGFMLAGAVAGELLHRVGTRYALVLGGAACIVGGLGDRGPPALRRCSSPIQVVIGFGIGLVESVLNVFLSELPAGDDPAQPPARVLRRRRADRSAAGGLDPALLRLDCRLADALARVGAAGHRLPGGLSRCDRPGACRTRHEPTAARDVRQCGARPGGRARRRLPRGVRRTRAQRRQLGLQLSRERPLAG